MIDIMSKDYIGIVSVGFWCWNYCTTVLYCTVDADGENLTRI